MALMDLNGGTIPTTPTPGFIGTPVSSMASGLGASGSNSQNTNATPPGGNTQGQPSSGSTPDNSAGGAQTPASGQPVNPLSLLKPTGPVDGPVLGAFLTGVGGGTKSDAPSIKVYNFGKKYKDWEFIWNPLEDQARAAQQALSGAGGQPGSPLGIGIPGPSGAPTGFGGTIVPPLSSPPQPQPQNP